MYRKKLASDSVSRHDFFGGQQIPTPPIGSKSICYKLGLPARQTAKVVVCT